MNFNEWLKGLPGSPTVSQAADRAQLSRATLLRHEKAGRTTAESVIAIARAYGVNEVTALIDCGFVDAAAVEALGVEIALGVAKNSQILAEIEKRSDPDARRIYRAEGLPGVVDLADDAEVFDFPTPNVTPLGDDEMPESAVAYSGPDEDQLRQEDDVD